MGGTIPIIPQAVSEVPDPIPARGVFANHQVILLPPQFTPGLDRTQAIAAARKVANAQRFPATAVLASLTDPGPIPPPHNAVPFHTLQNVPVWVVTFTVPPTNMAVGGVFPHGGRPPVVIVRHWNIAISARSGYFVLGFFTP